MKPEEILHGLAKHGAVLTNKHFVYTSGLHGPAYVNMRAAAHDSELLHDIASDLADVVDEYEADVIIGPETLGRTLAGLTGTYFTSEVCAIWCDIVEEDGVKRASFSPKLDFGRFITPGVKVAIVDDLLTTGSSVKLTADLVASLGGEVVVAAVVVRRTPDVTAEDCGAQVLTVLAEVDGFATFSEQDCRASGPCSERVPMVLRPGHGHEWILIPENSKYPVA
jgi:orotate phosphoribosyltransferase